VIFDEEGEEVLKGQVPHLGGAQGFVNGGMGGAIAFHFILKTSSWSFLEVFLVLLDGCSELWEEELLKGDLVLRIFGGFDSPNARLEQQTKCLPDSANLASNSSYSILV
jgi:hypothetical protein